MRGVRAAAILLAVSLAGPAGADDVPSGEDAFVGQDGELAQAIRQLQALQGVAAAADATSGEDAFVARDWELARAIWQLQAQEGSPRALLGLGNLADLGVSGGRNPGEALRYYRAAAEAGLAEGAFNVGALLERSGGRAAAEAPLWYSCAALAGHARARYALGQLYADGLGLPENPDLARYWLDLAAVAVPAARSARDRLQSTDPGRLTAPQPLGSVAVRRDGGRRVCLAWSAPPQGAGAVYRVELLRGSAPLVETDGAITTGSAVELPLPDDAVLWRVVAVDNDARTYVPSPWRSLGGDETSPPLGTVNFRTEPGDLQAARLARRMGSALERSGAIVSYEDAQPGTATSTVDYGFAGDAQLAEDIAGFLPGTPEIRSDAATALAPGEIVVTLVFDR